MVADRLTLINQSIVGLQRLADAFASEPDPAGDSAGISFASRTAQPTREALLTIRVLLPKLEAARALLHAHRAPPIRCIGCED
ncbi:MAG: hypothetical protein U1F35_19745 [Steroidobacteraceae bacterium]